MNRFGHLSYDPEADGCDAEREANDVPSGVHAIVQVMLNPWIGPRVAQIVWRPHAPTELPNLCECGDRKTDRSKL